MAKFMIAALALVALLGFVEAVPVLGGLDILGNAQQHAQNALGHAAGVVEEGAAIVGLDGLARTLTGVAGGAAGGQLSAGLGVVGGVAGQAQGVAGGLPLPLPIGRK